MPDNDLLPTEPDDVLHGKGGHRQRWEDLPAPVRAGIEARLGAPVLDAASQAGGFSPGVACRVTLADGRRAFVKAISGTAYPRSVGLYRTEERFSRPGCTGSSPSRPASATSPPSCSSTRTAATPYSGTTAPG